MQKKKQRKNEVKINKKENLDTSKPENKTHYIQWKKDKKYHRLHTWKKGRPWKSEGNSENTPEKEKERDNKWVSRLQAGREVKIDCYAFHLLQYQGFILIIIEISKK